MAKKKTTKRKTTRKATKKTVKKAPKKRVAKKVTKKRVSKKAPVRRVKRRTSAKKKTSNGVKLALAIVGLVLNVAILPGLGSLVAGKIKTGVLQLVFLLIGFLLTLTVIGAILGIPLMIAVWVWGIVTGVKAIQESV